MVSRVGDAVADDNSVTRISIRTAATVLAVAAGLSGAALGVSERASASQATTGPTLDSFGGTTPVATGVAHRIVPLYRERSVSTSFKLQRVPCASAVLGDSSACYAAR